MTHARNVVAGFVVGLLLLAALYVVIERPISYGVPLWLGSVVGWFAHATRRRYTYRARWHPTVNTTPSGAVVYVVKRSYDEQIRHKPPAVRMKVGEIDADAEDFDDRLAELLRLAGERSEVLSLEQNIHNRYG